MNIEGTQGMAMQEIGEYRYAYPSIGEGGSTTMIDIYVEKLPEDVFLGTSPELPGLTVEADSRDEMIEEARATALVLLELAGKTEARRLRFRFIEFG